MAKQTIKTTTTTRAKVRKASAQTGMVTCSKCKGTGRVKQS